MARFDVYSNPGPHAGTTPFLLDVQSNLLDSLDSTLVIPFRSLLHFPKVNLPTRLTPIVSILGQDYLLETPKMGAVPKRVLKNCVASLAENQACITAAMDFLFHGY